MQVAVLLYGTQSRRTKIIYFVRKIFFCTRYVHAIKEHNFKKIKFPQIILQFFEDVVLYVYYKYYIDNNIKSYKTF